MDTASPYRLWVGLLSRCLSNGKFSLLSGILDIDTGDMYYSLEPESLADHEKVAELLFTEGELEVLP